MKCVFLFVLLIISSNTFAIGVADIGKVTLKEVFPSINKFNYRYPDIKVCTNKGRLVFSRAASEGGFPTGEEKFYLSQLYYGYVHFKCDESIDVPIDPVYGISLGSKLPVELMEARGFRVDDYTGDKIIFHRKEKNPGMYFGKNMDGYPQSILVTVGIKNGVVVQVSYTADFYM